MSDQPTRYRLAADLWRAEAPTGMVVRAKAGAYDDYLSESATPKMDLVTQLRRWGADNPKMLALVERVIAGEYDATEAEADAWARSPDGQAAWNALINSTPAAEQQQ